MSTGLKPEEPSADDEPGFEEEQANLRAFNRSPHPYIRHGLAKTETARYRPGDYQSGRDDSRPSRGEDEAHAGAERWRRSSGHSASTGSESGTEADDESDARPRFFKALPAPESRPSKGLRTGEKTDDDGLHSLLTPSQLDDEGRQLRKEYFDRTQAQDEEEARVAQQRLYRRRFAEFVRRSSEVALMGMIFVCVLCGRDVLAVAQQWLLPIISHLTTTSILILSYPLKLSFLDSSTTFQKPWQRFSVPASFDPATVLYPTFLPFLVALALGPSGAAAILPNLILGLAALPQRLFPRSSRFDGINCVHWLLSATPLLVAQRTSWLSADFSSGNNPNAAAEYLISLYPLHHILLQPLHYLTTTSLLVSELHLLSAGLINLLFLSQRPQAVILKACLWIGGLGLFVAVERVLHWNVTLARVPRWRLRRPGHSQTERDSVLDAVRKFVSERRFLAAFQSVPNGGDSDADEDYPTTSLKSAINSRPRVATHSTMDFTDLTLSKTHAPFSAIEHPREALGWFSEKPRTDGLQRRNTLAEGQRPNIQQRRADSTKKHRPAPLLWCLQLTPAQAQQRKWLYAALVYCAIIFIVLVPVRVYVARHALHGSDPIGWAVGYLVGTVPFIASVSKSFGLDGWIPLSQQEPRWPGLSWHVPFSVEAVRQAITPGNTRLLIIVYLATVIALGLLTVFSLTAYVEVDTRRKVFHGVMVAMLVPATFVDPCFCALALALVLAIFLLLEVIRAGQVPPLGNAIGRFVAPYVDGRDLRGPVVVSHVFLLIGSAIPLWLSLASHERKRCQQDDLCQGWELDDDQRDVAMLAGVVCVGMGDAAASLIGRRFGRRKWIWVGGKSLEGSAAFAIAVTIGLMAGKVWLWLGGWTDAMMPDDFHLQRLGPAQYATFWAKSLIKAMFCGCSASFMEAVLTGANDNVVVPVALWLLVRGTRL